MKPEPAKDGMRPIGDRAYDLLSEYVERFDGYRDAAQSGEDPEAIHQMRVNVRRIRALLRSFASILPRQLLNQESHLKWIATSLGDVRDVDVHMEHADDETLAKLLAGHRAARLAQMRHDLDSGRYRELVESLRSLCGARETTSSALAETPILLVGPDTMRRTFSSVRKAARVADPNAPSTAVHTLRKRAKRLRYTVDCFAGLYGKPGKRFVGCLKDLQDVLGGFQDAVVAQEFYSELKGHGIDDLLHEHERQAAERASRLQDDLATHLANLRDRWKLLRREMSQQRRQVWKAG